MRRGGAIGALGLALLLLCQPGAAAAASAPSAFATSAAPSRAPVTLYRMPRTLPTGGTGPIAIDPLGNAWFNETYEEPGEPAHHPGEIVRMNRQGEITVLATRKRGQDFAVSPDSSIWFSGFRGIGRIAPDGQLTEFPLPQDEEGGPTGLYSTVDEGPLVVTPDGNVWFTATRHPLDEEGREAGSEPIIGRFTPDGVLSEFTLPGGGGFPTRLAVGPDGNVWFTAASVQRVGFITSSGQIQEFPPLPAYSDPNFIAAGPDGAIWFTEYEEGPVIGRMTTAGTLSKFRLGGKEEAVEAGALAAGPDGRIWFTAGEGEIGRISPSGRISRVALPQSTYAEDLAVGPEGDVWYTSPAEPPCLPGDAACGQGGYYQSGIVGRIEPAPLSVEIGSKAKLIARAHRLKLRLTCLDGNANSTCRGRIRIKATGTVMARPYNLGTDLSRAFTVHLSSKARTHLLKHHRLRIKAAATLSGGHTATKSLRLRIRP